MNIFKKVKNNLKYAHYRKLSNKAIVKMEKHKNDADDTEWRKWAAIELRCLQKCLSIPTK